MNQQDQSSNKFIELMEFKISDDTVMKFQGNVIKNISLESVKFNSLQVETECDDEPQVIIRKQGDSIENIEFICSCGKKKIINFEYEAE